MRPHKAYPHCMCIAIEGNPICCPGDVGTPWGYLDLTKIIINSVLSQRHARFINFDIKNFYLETPMEPAEYAHIKISNIYQELIDEYNLTQHTCNGWVYFEFLW